MTERGEAAEKIDAEQIERPGLAERFFRKAPAAGAFLVGIAGEDGIDLFPDMRSDDPVTITKDNASIVARTMEITDKGRVITFEGNVRMNVESSAIHKQGT